MNLNEVAIFVKIIELGSFTAAAIALEMPKSTVSTRLSSLEKRLGVTLIRRTTRKLHMTEAGEHYYNECLEAISRIIAAEAEVLQNQVQPHGLMKITAPVELGGELLPEVVKAFNKKYPQVDLEIILTDRAVDLIDEKIDIGIRVGKLSDSSLMAKRIGNIYFAPFAGPKLIKNLNPVKSPKDLENYSLIIFTSLGPTNWRLLNNKEKKTIKVDRKITVNDLNLIKSMVMANMGIALIPTFLCINEVKSGQLIRVLNNWRTELRPVHFIYPYHKYVSPNIKAFIELAGPMLKKSMENAEL